LVPIAFAVVEKDDELLIYSAIDEKPKSVDDPRALARVRDVVARPEVSVLVDDWDEDWSRLAWLRLDGTARLIEPVVGGAEEHAAATRLLRERYPQYESQRLEGRPLLRIAVERAVGWSARG
jgi:coenzyme F420-0:L-glutamate ligase/coenzyme F420-1:gamma-L-glutamate ligase